MHLQFPKEEFAVLQQINSFFFKGKNATAPLSQGGVNFLRLSTNAAPVFTDQCPRPEETFDPVWFLVKLDCRIPSGHLLFTRETHSCSVLKTGSVHACIQQDFLPLLCPRSSTADIKRLPNQPHSSSNYALTYRVVQQNEDRKCI